MATKQTPCTSAGSLGSLMRNVLFSCRETGIAVISEDLRIQECSPTFAAILLGRDVAEEAIEQCGSDAEALRGELLTSYMHDPEEERQVGMALEHLNMMVQGKSLGVAFS